MSIPFVAYHGNEPYIFASYSHRDKNVVYPELHRLHLEGFRIWYDEGIPPATKWAEEIAKAIQKCDCFLVFLSSQAIKSEHVKNEIHLALEEKKPVLAIHLEPFDMPAELRLQLSRIQALKKYSRLDQEYYLKLTNFLPPALKDPIHVTPSQGIKKETSENIKMALRGFISKFRTRRGEAVPTLPKQAMKPPRVTFEEVYIYAYDEDGLGMIMHML